MEQAAKHREFGLLDYSAALQKRHEATTSPEERRESGQVFTPPGIGRFMAGLLTRFPDPFRLLDAGAGVGTLTAAVCERILTLRSTRQIDVSLYEIDPTLLPLLEENMRHCRDVLETSGYRLTYSIHPDDFILKTQAWGRRTLFDDDEAAEDFDAAIMNPPYFKVAAKSAHARSKSDSIQGQPNMYTLFMARATELLRPNGEVVAITPRSFCNGLYYKAFRRWFFSRMTLRHVHLFECRRGVFDNVLQESMITYTNRMGIAALSATITTSVGRDIAGDQKGLDLPVAKLLDDSADEMVLRIPTTAEEAAILDTVESWPERFQDLGLGISTGPVVMFRAEEFLLPKIDGENSAPLIGPHNVKPFETVWPLERRGKPTAFRVCSRSLKHLVPTRNYVFLRRFSAKEERRRLTASWFLSDEESRPYLALENHINYIYHTSRELSQDEAFGLTALFNSALLDRYFRIISGNTQVNATEIRSIRFPNLDRVTCIGQRLRETCDFSPATIERIVLQELGINGRLGDDLMGTS